MGIETDLGHAGLTLLRADDDDTVGGPATIDGGTGGIFQNLDVVDVAGSQIVNVVYGHTVDHVERIVGTIQGGGAAYTNRRCRTWLSVGLTDLQSGRLALHPLHGTYNGARVEIGGRDARNGGGYILALDRSITDGHHLVEHVGFLFEHDFHVGSSFHNLGFIANVGNAQRSVSHHLDGKPTIRIGSNAIRRALLQDRGANDRLVALVGHRSFHADFLRESCQGQQQDQRQKHESLHH